MNKVNSKIGHYFLDLIVSHISLIYKICFVVFPTYDYVLLYKYWLISLVGKVFANGSADRGSIPGRVIPKTLKMVLDTSLLRTQRIRFVSKVKWSSSGEELVSSPTPRCSCYWKGSIRVSLDNSRLKVCINDLNHNVFTCSARQ